jgi:hypothetical protein
MVNNRPDHPAEAQFYIRLVSEKKLPTGSIKKFFNTVNQRGPQNTTTVFEVAGPNNEPAQAALVHRIGEDTRHQYEIPLTRNYTPDELMAVVQELDRSIPEGDFLLESSTFDDDCCVYEDEGDDYLLEEDVMEQMAIRISQRLHEKWLNERMDKGWRYGEQQNVTERTHPLIKPWAQLPEEHRKIDYELPQLMVDILEDHGYTVISNDELNSLIEDATKKRPSY